jgi:hypothetical protein
MTHRIRERGEGRTSLSDRGARDGHAARNSTPYRSFEGCLSSRLAVMFLPRVTNERSQDHG